MLKRSSFFFFFIVWLLLPWIASSKELPKKIENLCRDTDGGKQFALQGSVAYGPKGAIEIFTDYCLNRQTVREYYCGDEKKSIVVKSEDFRCEEGCQEGACRPQVRKRAERHQCFDPDGTVLNRVGPDIYFKTRTEGEVRGQYEEREDFCPHSNDPKVLREYLCRDEHHLSWQDNRCPGGEICYEGACWIPCSDSDNSLREMGEDRLVRGETIGYVDRRFRASAWHRDTCVSGHILREYFCEEDQLTLGVRESRCPQGEGCDERFGSCVPLQTAFDQCGMDEIIGHWHDDAEYYLTQDIVMPGGNYCFQIAEVSNIVFDCRGHSITCQEGRECVYGIFVNYADHITIRNCTVSGFNFCGMQILGDHMTLMNNNAHHNLYGISVIGSEGLTVNNNQACDNVGVDFGCSGFSRNARGDNNTFGEVIRCLRGDGWPFSYNRCGE